MRPRGQTTRHTPTHVQVKILSVPPKGQTLLVTWFDEAGEVGSETVKLFDELGNYLDRSSIWFLDNCGHPAPATAEAAREAVLHMPMPKAVLAGRSAANRRVVWKHIPHYRPRGKRRATA